MTTEAETSQGVTCYVIGADTLLIECSERLLEAGIQIKGVITAAPPLVDWATAKGLPVIDETSDYRAKLAADPFDYLFSITHLKLIPDEILSMAKIAAINFHDGPLPAYAGLNTPAWALMNEEKEYGITWHVMTSGVDAGDVVAAPRYEIADEETSLSLNTKNFAAALESFEALIPQFKARNVPRTPQTSEGRRVYMRSERPAHAAVIDFEQPASAIEALVRGLHFGRYPNNLATPKIRFGDRLASVQVAAAVEDESDRTPGTVLAIDDGLTIKCGQDALRISELWSIRGQSLSIDEFVQAAGLSVGSNLDGLSADQKARLTDVNVALAKAEPFWLKRLSGLVPAQLAFGASAPGAEVRFESRALDVPESYTAMVETHGVAGVVAGIVAYLARTNAQDSFHINFAEDALRSELGDVAPWVSTDVPFACRLDFEESYEGVRARVAKELDRVRSKKAYLEDLVGRHPLLSQNA
ncbi:MAG: formyltransferase family protein, partial [Myxococcota bacterium]